MASADIHALGETAEELANVLLRNAPSKDETAKLKVRRCEGEGRGMSVYEYESLLFSPGAAQKYVGPAEELGKCEQVGLTWHDDVAHDIA